MDSGYWRVLERARGRVGQLVVGVAGAGNVRGGGRVGADRRRAEPAAAPGVADLLPHR
jgi:hypothetical protein